MSEGAGGPPRASRLPGPERVLDLVGIGAGGGDVRIRSAAFLRFLLLHLAARDAIRWVEGLGDVRAAWSLGFAACLALSFVPELLRVAACAGLLLATTKLALIFPDNSNHFFLEYLCLVFASLVSFRREDELEVFVRGVRCLPVLVLIWSGVNKAIYGTYFNGAYLGSILSHSGFALVFSFTMSGEELRTLLATRPPGPYAFSAPFALLLSNGVWLGEIAAGLLLLLPRVRWLGVLLALALLLGIELGARELMFGALMTNMLCLYYPASWSRALLPASAAFYAVLLATRVGLLPGWSFN